MQDLKILSFIPSHLHCHTDITFQLCAASLAGLEFILLTDQGDVKNMNLIRELNIYN